VTVVVASLPPEGVDGGGNLFFAVAFDKGSLPPPKGYSLHAGWRGGGRRAGSSGGAGGGKGGDTSRD
jgi:hypothetical protein